MAAILLNMVVGANGTIALQGELTFATVEEALILGRGIFGEQGGDITIDLSGVRRVDCAGMALLISWVRETRAGGRQIFFINSPRHLLRLAQSSDLEEILPFTDTTMGDLPG